MPHFPTVLAAPENILKRRELLLGMLALGATAPLLRIAPAMAAGTTYDVQMRNKGAAGAMVYEPGAIKIAVGDTLTFTPVDKGHNVETIKGMIPDGAATFKSKISEPFTTTFDVPGVYGLKCTPHFAMGMVILVMVGEGLENLDAVNAVKLPAKAAERFNAAYAVLGI